MPTSGLTSQFPQIPGTTLRDMEGLKFSDSKAFDKKFVQSYLYYDNPLVYFPVVTLGSFSRTGIRILGSNNGPQYTTIGQIPDLQFDTPTYYTEQPWTMTDMRSSDETSLATEEGRMLFDLNTEIMLQTLHASYWDVLINNTDSPGGISQANANNGTAGNGYTGYQRTNTVPSGNTSTCNIAGIKQRCADPKWEMNTGINLNFGSTDMRAANGTNASMGTFMSNLMRLYRNIGSKPDGKTDYGGSLILLDEVLKDNWSIRLEQAGNTGGFKITEDLYDREIETWRGAKLVVPGRQMATATGLQNQRYISIYENADGTDSSTWSAGVVSNAPSAGSQFTSVYVVKTDLKNSVDLADRVPKQGLALCQIAPMVGASKTPWDSTAKEENFMGVQHYRRYNVSLGLLSPETRAFGRLGGTLVG
jgi:hypothetical protein